MEYLIAGACSVWFLAFVLLEDRVGGAVGVALRLLGAVPFLVLLVAWTDRFRSDALLIVLVAILLSTTVESVVRWRRRRAHGQRPPG
jgi:hypothetical protein